MITTTREPTVWPTMASPNPGDDAIGREVRGPRPQLWSKTSPVVQLTPWYCTVTCRRRPTTATVARDHGRDLQVGRRVGIRDRHGRLAVVGPGHVGEPVGQRHRSRPRPGSAPRRRGRATKTTGSPGPTPRSALPVSPKPSAGGHDADDARADRRAAQRLARDRAGTTFSSTVAWHERRSGRSRSSRGSRRSRRCRA